MKRRNHTPLAHDTIGWAIYKGDAARDRRGNRLIIVGREGNVMLVRPFVPAYLLPVSLRTSSVPVRRVHPTELGLRSNVTLPDYVR